VTSDPQNHNKEGDGSAHTAKEETVLEPWGAGFVIGVRLANPECIGTTQRPIWIYAWEPPSGDDEPPALTTTRVRPRPRPGAPGRAVSRAAWIRREV
jgi:hypothetical protein